MTTSNAAAEVRLGILRDVDDVARIWREGWGDAHLGHVPAALVTARTPASFDERARDRVSDTIVATRAGVVAGFVMTDGDQVDQLYLDRSARGGGLGSALLDAAEQAVLAAGHRVAWLAVATGNTGARRFYERHGWIDEGPFVHQAPVPAGSVAVDCHRFVSPRR
ncbi:GNAT family N-acetyltransferase [Microbacterium ulmi]|uniref:GNAT family N-acetyltransferase n=1 Tax=Microbacterium ulmi TaxID=179095 RepID=A0A7Y2Q149_9MICO|nr:GNAT family N-acetyltransferase [Microbacterium ulmi]NII68990.1 GNAT superfamily N-acetyltransferase [Microbacterium ulmi]NNH03972.1 GNAT family N-acetyltransferase [Microbacterium ulmi]